jgi:hypothetical protein
MSKMLRNPILKVGLNRIIKNIGTFYLILQNELHENEILILKKIQLSGALKNTYVLSNYECYNHNISKKLI